MRLLDNMVLVEPTSVSTSTTTSTFGTTNQTEPCTDCVHHTAVVSTNTPTVPSTLPMVDMNRREKRRYKSLVEKHNRAEKKRVAKQAEKILRGVNPYTQPEAVAAVNQALADAYAKLDGQRK